MTFASNANKVLPLMVSTVLTKQDVEKRYADATSMGVSRVISNEIPYSQSKPPA